MNIRNLATKGGALVVGLMASVGAFAQATDPFNSAKIGRAHV